MRKAFALALTFVLALIGTPVGLFAASAPGQTGTLNVTAKDAKQKELPAVKVQVRDKKTGALVATGTTNGSGAFTFAGLAPGSYTIEIVDAAGNIVGVSAAVTLGAGAAATVTVTAAAAGAIGSAGTGGVGLFGLGTIGTVAVVGAAGTAAIVGYEVTKSSSPSR